MLTKDDMKQIEEQAALFLDDIIAFRRDLHRHPEVGRQEERTAGQICGALESMGIEFSRNNTAVTAHISGSKPGGCVALRADIDALPIKEDSGLEFASSSTGRMHACGHDGHTAILLGAGRWFHENRTRFSGTVKLLFQPDEEGDGGAEPMIRAGVLENPRVDRVFGLHVMPYLPVGQIEVKKGALNGSSTLFTITVTGESGHGAYPESGIDAVLIAGYIITAVQSLVSRRVSPLDSAVISIGTIEGGKAGNIIADRVTMKGTMRTADNDLRDSLVGQLKSLVENTALAHGGKAELDYHYGYAALVNTDHEVDLAARIGETYLGKDRVLWKEKPSLGVEDFSFFLQKVPGCFYHLGCGSGVDAAPLHSSRFVLNEDCLLPGIVLQVGLVLESLEELA